MLSRDENEILTRVGASTPMGELMRRYWIPALLSEEIPVPDCPPVRVRLLGEDLVAFRDTQGKIGLLDEHCSHRGTSLFYGRCDQEDRTRQELCSDLTICHALYRLRSGRPRSRWQTRRL